MDVWKECNGQIAIRTINETAWRIVDEEKIATRKLVDSIEEQKILDELIESSKPALSILQTKFHPLLHTPFSHPPLKHGSRFGKKTEQALWYGSLNIETAMVEKAFYQFAFINASACDFGIVTTPVIIFSAKLKIAKGIKLHERPFIKYTNIISSPINYEYSQLLGTNMRRNDIDGFTFISARDINKGINVGLFKINAFANKNPDPASFQTWQCSTTKNKVEFVQIGSINDRSFSLPIENFQIDDLLPFPAI